MSLELQIIAALALDAVFGDPRWLPHPVRLIGWLARMLERTTRRFFSERAAGVITALTVIVASGTVCSVMLTLAGAIHSWVADVTSILVLYTTFAAGDLALHARNVEAALEAEDLAEARRRVGLIVGRDTESLDERGVVRAAVESVAENTVDGVTAPLIFACLCGPVGAVVYKAVNTLDSTFGYKNERYFNFGWASARIDDVANYVPARLTALFVSIAAALVGQRPLAVLRIMRRDGRKHPSPNAGLTEAAMAGALGVQLGGLTVYQGRRSEKPTLGDDLIPLHRKHIRQTIRLMWLTMVVTATVLLLVRCVLTSSFWFLG